MGREIRDPEDLNEITSLVISCAMDVHRALGPGLLEQLYEEALCIELSQQSVAFDRQRIVSVEYKGARIGEHRLDLVVQDLVVVELKAVDEVAPKHLAQLVSYLKIGRFPLGLLLNFNVARMKDGIYRRANTRRLAKDSS